jgi:16S rRNA (cytosine1402-N4)-methyltransferase
VERDEGRGLVMEYHNPVLLKECIDGLKINPKGIYVDVTFGGGGHSREILKHLTTGKLYAFDQDADAERNKIDDDRFVLIKQNFRYLKNFLKMYNALPIDGLLADLGVSSHQFDEADRGFSTRFDAKLDMRMDRNAKLTAADILNTYTEEELKKIFKLYGEVDNAGRLAYVVFHARKEKQIETVNDLKAAIEKCVKRGRENQYYAQVFQALRIEVNKELDVLKDLLIQSLEVLKPGGRLVVISYQSLEDRLVKNIIRSGKFEGEVEKDFYGNQLAPFETITRKPIVPGEEEITENSRARSAKLRIAEKK